MTRYLASIFISLTAFTTFAFPKDDAKSPTSKRSHAYSVFQNLLQNDQFNASELLFSTDINLDNHTILAIKDSLNSQINFLRTIQSKEPSTDKFIKFTFLHFKTKYLRKYTPNANFVRIFTHHEYDCVTGSALIAYAFDELQIKYEIVETYSHTCIKVKGDSSIILLESTSNNGIIDKNKDIFNRLHEYQLTRKEETIGIFNYAVEAPHYYLNKINLKKLIGILYYNKAIQSVAAKNYEQSIILSEIAEKLYPSPRSQGLLLYSISNLLKDPKLDFKNKTILYKKLKNILEDSQTENR